MKSWSLTGLVLWVVVVLVGGDEGVDLARCFTISTFCRSRYFTISISRSWSCKVLLNHDILTLKIFCNLFIMVTHVFGLKHCVPDLCIAMHWITPSWWKIKMCHENQRAQYLQYSKHSHDAKYYNIQGNHGLIISCRGWGAQYSWQPDLSTAFKVAREENKWELEQSSECHLIMWTELWMSCDHMNRA